VAKDFNTLTNAVDAYAKRVEVYMQEMLALTHKVDRLEQWIQVRKDQVIRPDGSQGIYGAVEAKPLVFIVALNGKKELCFIDCFRYTSNCMSIELPAGGTDGEEPLVAAQRELQEETGFKAQSWRKLGELDAHNGICQEVMHVFLATDLKQTGDHRQKDDGITRNLLLTINETYKVIDEGRMQDSETIAALTLARIYLTY